MLQITMVTAALMALIGTFLSVFVSQRRRATKIARGDGGDKVLAVRIRAFGNFSEYAPLAVILVGLLELSGTASVLTGLVAAAFVAGRVVHAVGTLVRGAWIGRAIAMALQHLASLAAALLLLGQAFG